MSEMKEQRHFFQCSFSSIFIKLIKYYSIYILKPKVMVKYRCTNK